MILNELKNVIEREKRKNDFVYPFYEKYCFSNIPSTILELFDVKSKRAILPYELYKSQLEIENYDKVVLLLIDGLGYNQWLKCYKNYEFFDTFSQKGVVLPITSVFPSTTAATLTTINTGLTPQEHALLEWVLYFKEIDMILTTLPFTPVENKYQNKQLEKEVNPEILYKGDTIYQTLKKEGIKSFTFVKEAYANSAYSKLVHKGSTTIPFIKSSDLVVRLRKTLEKEKGPTYFYVYVDDVDSAQHKYGPHTEEYYAELSDLSFLLKKMLLEKIDRKVAKEILLLVTADHGQINVSPKDTVYLNKYRRVVNSFQISEKNKPILPTGGPRDVFLHVNQNKIDEVYDFLSNKLKEKAKIIRTQKAVEIGLFG